MITEEWWCLHVGRGVHSAVAGETRRLGEILMEAFFFFLIGGGRLFWNKEMEESTFC